MTNKIRSDIKSVEHLAITHDGWTSMNTESYGTVTVHLIDKQWNLQSYVLETKKIEGSHTAQKIADSLKVTQMEWGLGIPIGTTDNAANEKKAFELLGWDRLGCYGHRINLIVKNGLSVPEVGSLLKKARRLVSFFHSSSSATDELKKKQNELFPKPDPKADYKLIMDVCTRWNSTFSMLERVIDLTPALVALANASDIKINKTSITLIRNCVFSFEEVEIAQKIVQLLSYFKSATEILCAEAIPTMHKVVPVVLKLHKAVKVQEEDHPILVAMKTTMQSELEKRTEMEDIPLLACALNPFTKNFDFAPEQKGSVLALLREAVMGITVTVKKEPEVNNNIAPIPNEPSQSALQELETDTEVNVVEPPVKKRKAADFEDWLDDVVFTGESQVSTEEVAEKELEMYMSNSQPIQGNPTLLEWWKCNELVYPRLAKLARKYLCCQASSVPSERVFSLAGHLVNKKRSRLNASNVDMMICLNKNLKNHW